MFHFLEADIRKQKVWNENPDIKGNTVNDPRYEIKFENCVKDKKKFLSSETLLFFLEQKYILFSEA